MKTFLTVLQDTDDSAIVKSFTVDGVNIKLKADIFKYLLISNLLVGDKADESNIVTYNPNGPRLSCNIKKLSNNIISITVTPRCDYCHGTREFECGECNGHGEYECETCGSYVECKDCDGIGIIDCDYCSGDVFDENEILFYEEININQGELF